MTTPMPTDPAMRDEQKDATAELAYYAEMYRDAPIAEQFDLLLVYTKYLAAETQNTSLTNSRIAWLTRSVRSALETAARPAPAAGVTIPVDVVIEAAEALEGKAVRGNPKPDAAWKRMMAKALRHHVERAGFVVEGNTIRATPAPGEPVTMGSEIERMTDAEVVEEVETIINEVVWEIYGGAEDDDLEAGFLVRERIAGAGYVITADRPTGAVTISNESGRAAIRALNELLRTADIDYDYTSEKDALDELEAALATPAPGGPGPDGGAS